MIKEEFKNTIRKYNLLKKGDRIVVGVSGGPDSVCLLYLLYDIMNEFRLKLYIVHLDHMLRKDSYKDREFVEKLGKELNIPVTSKKINIKTMAKCGSIEEIARNARLDFFFSVAKDVKAEKIALGHNFDDQAETVLMRIIRGTGLYGLSGILPKRRMAGFDIIRPFIEIRRKEIESFLKRKRIKARIDTSNKQDLYFRNKIRNKLLPLLANKYNKNIKEVLSNLAQSAGYDYDFLLQSAERLIRRRTGRFRVDELKKIHPAILRLILRSSIFRVKGDTRRITFKHIREIEDLILNRPKNSIVDLPKGISVIKKKHLIFKKYRGTLQKPGDASGFFLRKIQKTRSVPRFFQ